MHAYSQEAVGAPAEYPVQVADRGLSTRRRAWAASCSCGSCPFDVVVEAFDDVSGARLF